MLVRFMAKRVAVLAVLATIIFLLLCGFTLPGIAGIWLGAFLGVYRMYVSSRVIAKTGGGAAGPVIAQVGLLLVSLAVLLVSALVDVLLFAGVAVGLLLAPLFICINALTERIGLTHNAWGGRQGNT